MSGVQDIAGSKSGLDGGYGYSESTQAKGSRFDTVDVYCVSAAETNSWGAEFALLDLAYCRRHIWVSYYYSRWVCNVDSVLSCARLWKVWTLAQRGLRYLCLSLDLRCSVPPRSHVVLIKEIDDQRIRYVSWRIRCTHWHFPMMTIIRWVVSYVGEKEQVGMEGMIV